MTTKQRRTREKAQRVKDITDAARAVFLKKGYQNASVEEIAQKAELSKGAVYFYFKNKDELYVSLMIPMIERLRQQLEEFEKGLLATKGKPRLNLIEDLFKIFIKTHEFDPEASRIFQIYQLNHLFTVVSPPIKDKLNSVGKTNFEIMRRIISLGVKMKLLREVDPYKLADLLDRRRGDLCNRRVHRIGGEFADAEEYHCQEHGAAAEIKSRPAGIPFWSEFRPSCHYKWRY